MVKMIKSVEKALSILSLLGTDAEREFPLTEIASTLKMDVGTCANLIKTLRCQGFIDQETPRKGYRLGYKIYHLTGRYIENDQLTKIARADIQALGRKFNETALLSVTRNDKRIVLFNTIPDREILVRTNVERSIYSACTGRVIIANYSPVHLDKFLVRAGIPTREEWPEIYESENPEGALRNALASIRHAGYVVHHDRNGIIGFGAPLMREGHIVGSVGLYLPISRLGNEQATLQAVIDCARRINEKLERSQ